MNTSYANNDRIDDIREHLRDFAETAKTTGMSIIEFAVNNPVAFCTIIGTAGAGFRVLGKQLDIHRADKLRNSTIYDRSLGMYWETKKPLTANQRLVIESRHKAGEPYGKILSDMRILKR